MMWALYCVVEFSLHIGIAASKPARSSAATPHALKTIPFPAGGPHEAVVPPKAMGEEFRIGFNGLSLFLDRHEELREETIGALHLGLEALPIFLPPGAVVLDCLSMRRWACITSSMVLPEAALGQSPSPLSAFLALSHFHLRPAAGPPSASVAGCCCVC